MSDRRIFWDRDYLLDDRGNFLKIVGESHPEGMIISYIKYFPSPHATRRIRGTTYGYNSFVPKSFVVLKDDVDRFVFSPAQGAIITGTPRDRVCELFPCQEKATDILAHSYAYRNHPVGSVLIELLRDIDREIGLADIGITGSFLIDGYTERSDIDLVCYGAEAADRMRHFFLAHPKIEPYEGSHAIRLYERRMIHMAPMDFGVLLRQERRKIQGLWNGDVHVNCQPLRPRGFPTVFKDLRCTEVGEIVCIAEILDAREAQFSPAYYTIRVVDVLDSLFSGDPEFSKKIEAFVSFIGAFSGCFEVGERVFLDGKLVEMVHGSSRFYGIEVTPWNTRRNFKAQLVSA